MAKKPIELSTLEKLVPVFGKDKGMADEYKKSADVANKRIKEIMVKLKLTEFVAGGYKAIYSVAKSESYNEEAVLAYMHQHKELTPCIKTQEYVDWNVFEELVYAGKIPQTKIAALKKYKVIKETPKLTVKKVEE